MAKPTAPSWKEKRSVSLAEETLPVTCITADDWTPAEREGGRFYCGVMGHRWADGRPWRGPK